MLVTEKELFYRGNHFEYLDEIIQEAKNEEWTLKEFARELKFLNEQISPLFGFCEIPNRCFSCGKDLKLPAIMWNGCHGTDENKSTPIWFHPDCAIEFAENLKRDYARIFEWRQERYAAMKQATQSGERTEMEQEVQS
jgi:hypothetical protein